RHRSGLEHCEAPGADLRRHGERGEPAEPGQQLPRQAAAGRVTGPGANDPLGMFKSGRLWVREARGQEALCLPFGSTTCWRGDMEPLEFEVTVKQYEEHLFLVTEHGQVIGEAADLQTVMTGASGHVIQEGQPVCVFEVVRIWQVYRPGTT